MNQQFKFDGSKARPSLVPWHGVREVLRVLEFGARKYAAHSWSNVEPERYVEALGRHTMELLDRFRRDGLLCLDNESGLPVAAHIACNALFILAHPVLRKEPTDGTTQENQD